MSEYGFGSRAARYTHIPAASTDTKIVAGASVTIYAILVTATGASATCLLEENGTATEIMTLGVATDGNSQEFHGEWLADKGVQVTTSNCKVTIFHSGPGA